MPLQYIRPEQMLFRLGGQLQNGECRGTSFIVKVRI
jgi:hypothetical protein